MRSVPPHPPRTRAISAVSGLALLLAAVAAAPPAAEAETPTAVSAAAPTPSPLTAEQALAEARRTGAAVAVTGATTPTDTLTANPDGTFTMNRTVMPVRKFVQGAWKQLDATLRRNTDGTVSPTTATGDVMLSGGGTGPLATLSGGGKSLALTAPMPLPAPTLAGDTATYPNVLPGVDLTVTVDIQGGFSEFFIVRDAAAAANPALKTLTFATHAEGLTLANDATGNITGTDRFGRAVFTAPAPVMWDSTTPPDAQTASSVDGTGDGANTVPVAAVVTDDGIELTPNQTMLTAPSTVYPVFIDPAVAWSTVGAANNGWATVTANHPTTNYWKNTPDPNQHMQVGKNEQIWSHTMINFPIATSTLAGATIASATLDITEVYSYSCSPRPVTVYAPGTTLTSSNATWDSWKNIDHGVVIASANVAFGYDSSCPAHGVAFDVKAAIINDVAANKKTQTFVFTAANEQTDVNGYKEFLKTSPTLTIVYNHKPNTPTGMHTSPTTSCTDPNPTAVGDAQVSLYAPVSDPDGGALGVAFKLWKTSDPTQTALASSNPNTLTYTSGTTAVLIVPRATLSTAAGGTITQFSWRVQATDTNLTSDWSATCNFKFDPTRPGPPTLNAPKNPTPKGQPATFTVAPATGDTPTNYQYQINGAPPVTITAAAGTTSFNITPTRFTNTLTVTSLTAGGNFGQPASVTFNSTPAATATDADLTGDGTADLLTVGNINALPPGLWLADGKGVTGVNTNATNIGANGNGVSGTRNPAAFNNSQAITGHFTGTGLQDVLVYYPTGANAGGGLAINGNGDGSTLQPEQSGNGSAILPGSLADEFGNNPLQLANAGNTSGQNLAYPDLIAILGDTTKGYALSLYASQNGTTNYQFPARLDTVPTPTGGTDWNNWTITTTQLAGGTAMFLWNRTTGALHLWTNLAYNLNDGTFTYTPYTLSTNWNTGANLTLRAADINADGTPDVWTVGATATITPWLVSNLSGATGTITTQPAQSLITSNHTWPLNDLNANNQLGPVAIAADTTNGQTLTASGNVVWHAGDLFPQSVLLNTDPTGTSRDLAGTGNLVNNTPLVDTTKSFSVAVWVKPTTAGGVFVSEDGANSSRFILWNEQTDNTWRFGIATADSIDWTFDQAIAPFGANLDAELGVWTHLTAVYNAGNNTMSLYVNGTLRATAHHNAAATWPATGKFVAGRFLLNRQNAGYYAGQLSNLQTWNTALTPAQVGATNTQPTGRLTPFGATTWTPPGTSQKQTDIYGADPTGNLWKYTKTGTSLTAPKLLATGWNQFTGFGVADWNHDGFQDIVARDNTTCEMQVFLGTPDDLNPEPIEIGTFWCPYTPFGVGDWNKDGHQDIITVFQGDTTMYAYPGDLTGGTAARVPLGTSWTTDFTSYGIADVTTDGNIDLLTRLTSNGTLRIYPNFTGSGTQIGIGWQPFTSYGLTDANNDNKPDIIALENTTGILWLYPGNGDGTFGTRTQIATGW